MPFVFSVGDQVGMKVPLLVSSGYQVGASTMLYNGVGGCEEILVVEGDDVGHAVLAAVAVEDAIEVGEDEEDPESSVQSDQSD